mmetsp:Transcript_23633/g.36363  ORF Transcript_23633/g.36363 Transcript_23633/m.36363 type:complete len:90 (-) Transcript_23633:16-285(-)
MDGKIVGTSEREGCCDMEDLPIVMSMEGGMDTDGVVEGTKDTVGCCVVDGVTDGNADGVTDGATDVNNDLVIENDNLVFLSLDSCSCCS